MRLSLDAKPRGAMTKGQVRRLRREGQTLLSVSEAGKETEHYVVNMKAVSDVLHRGGPAALIELSTGNGRPLLTMARAVQRDPVSQQILSVGMVRVSARKPITAPVSVILSGEPEPVSQGIGVLEQEMTTVDVRALPDKMPAHVTVDVSDMQIGDKRLVSDIAATGDYEIVTPSDSLVAVLHVVRAAVTEEGAPEVEAEAPEAAEEESAASGGQPTAA